MAESELTRKRSRSSSDADQHQPKSHKRPNTGATSSAAPAEDASSQAAMHDVTMADHTQAQAGDNISVSPTSSSPTANPSASAAKTSVAEGGTDNLPSSSASAAASGDDPTSPTDAASGAGPTPSASIHMRCLIVTQDASIIIGRAGAHVNEIREKSGARVMVSESVPGNPERILNVSGPLDAVSKAFGLIVRRINDEPFDVPSVPGSRAVTMKFMIPNSRMGSVIGKQGAKIKEIQDASGARLNASEGMLPGSTERVLSITGVADAIHIATYYVGNILIEAQERQPSTANATYRPGSRARGSTYSSGGGSSYVPGAAPYGGYPAPAPAVAPGYPAPYAAAPGQMPMPGAQAHNPPQQLQTQQIYIPNDLVGCIIGKGGSKINEIRHMSASQIRIMEPGATAPGMNGAPPHAGSENERLVVITGQPANIQMAVQLLYHRLEQEKIKQQQLLQQGAGTTGTM